MRLVDLYPSWITSGEGRQGMGVSFLCPNHQANCYLAVWFANPTDGGPAYPPNNPNSGSARWQRVGETFTDLTLTPSINAHGHWHGFITAGEVSSG